MSRSVRDTPECVPMLRNLSTPPPPRVSSASPSSAHGRRPPATRKENASRPSSATTQEERRPRQNHQRSLSCLRQSARFEVVVAASGLLDSDAHKQQQQHRLERRLESRCVDASSKYYTSSPRRHRDRNVRDGRESPYRRGLSKLALLPQHATTRSQHAAVEELYKAAAAAVVAREAYLEKVVDDSVSGTVDATAAARDIRERTVLAVEAILDWRRSLVNADRTSPEAKLLPAFMWEGQNYLLRLAAGDDTEQLMGASAALVAAIKGEFGGSSEPPRARNPLLLDADLDALEAASPTNEISFSGSTTDQLDRVRHRRVARAIVAEERAVRADGLRAELTGRLALTESEAMRARPPDVDARDLDMLAIQARPRLPVVATLACLHLLLHQKLARTPGRGLPPMDKLLARPLRHTLLKGPRRIAAQLAAFDPAVPVPRDVLHLVWPVLTAEKFTIDEVRACSTTVARLHEWMQALVVLHSTKAPRTMEDVASPTPKRQRTDASFPGVDPRVVEIYGGHHRNRVAEAMHTMCTMDGTAFAFAAEDDEDRDDEDDKNAASGGSVKRSLVGARDDEARSKLEGLCNDLASLKSEVLALHQRSVSPKTEVNSSETHHRDVDHNRRVLLYHDVAYELPGTATPLRFSAYAVVTERETTMSCCNGPLKRPASIMAEYLLLSASTAEAAWQPRALPGAEVDRLTGYLPSDLASMTNTADRALALKPIFNSLAADSSSMQQKLVVLANRERRSLHFSQRVVNGVCLDVSVRLPLGGDDKDEIEQDVSVAADSYHRLDDELRMHVRVSPAVTELDPSDVLSLDLRADAIELLLLHQAGLYERAHLRWKALRTVADWIVSRLTFESRRPRTRQSRVVTTRDVALHERLDVDGTIPLTPSLARVVTPVTATLELELSPDLGGVELRLVNSDPTSPATDGARIASLVLGVDEIRALCCRRDDGLDDQPTGSALALLRERVTVDIEDQRARLHIDRVVYQEVRRISGKSATVQALAVGKDLVFRAVLVAPPPSCRNDGDEAPSNTAPQRPLFVQRFLPLSSSSCSVATDSSLNFDLTKVVTEADARLLVASEHPEHKPLLLWARNRHELARYLAAKLKLVELRAKTSDQPGSSSVPQPRYLLETTLVRESHLVSIGVDGSGRRALIGSLTIDDGTTLEQLRRLIALELDDEDVPSHYRFLYQRAPCARRQEPYRLAINCRPVVVLLTRKHPAMHATAAWSGDEQPQQQQPGGDEGREEDEKLKRKKKKKKKKNVVEPTKAKRRSERPTFRRRRLFSKIRDAFVRTSTRVLPTGPLGSDEAAPPRSLPQLVDPETPSTLQTVAVPLGTTAKVVQGSNVVEFDDDVGQLGVFDSDVLRIGNRLGADWSLADVSCAQGKTVALTTAYDHELATTTTTTTTTHKCTDVFPPDLPRSQTQHKKKTPDFDPDTLILADPQDPGAAEREIQKPAAVDIPLGARFAELTVYKLVPKALDMRPGWRVEFDNGGVEYHPGDFAESRESAVNFRVPLRYATLERLARDAGSLAAQQTHMQRVHFFEAVSVDRLIDEIFRLLCSWYPQSEEVDGAKWAKFARDNDLVPDVSNPVRAAQVDIAFKRQLATEADGKPAKGGRLNRPRLKEALIELAFVKYPRPPRANHHHHHHRRRAGSPRNKQKRHVAMDLEGVLEEDVNEEERHESLQRLLLDRVVMIPEISRRAWREAKVLAMLAEGRRQSAATRVQASHRGRWQHAAFRGILRAATAIETFARAFLSRKHYRLQRAAMRAGFVFRRRCGAAYRVQAMWRNYTVGRDYRERARIAREEYGARLAERRAVQHERATAVRDSVVFRRVKRVSGWLVKMCIRRLETSRAAATTNFGLKLEVYVPQTQETFTFKMTDEEVRASLELVLGLDGLSGSEILEPGALARIADRLLVRVISKRPIVIFTRRGHSERGTQVLRRGLVVSGEAFVITVFHSEDEVVFHAYSGKTCETLRTSVTTKYLEEWIMADAAAQEEAAAVERRRRVADARKLVRLAESGVSVAPAELDAAKKFIEGEETTTAEAQKTDRASQQQARGSSSADDSPPQVSADDDDDDDEDAATPDDDGEQGPTKIIIINDGKKQREGPLSMLAAEHLPELLKWLMARLRVIWYQRLGIRAQRRRRLVLEYEMDEVKQERAALAIQGMWKIRRSLARLRRMIRANWEKRYDVGSGQYYYVDLRTEEMFWNKPALLGSEDLQLAPDEWRQKVDDENGNVYYFNPATGQSSWLSVDEAARTMQRVYRKKQAADFGQPRFEDLVRALRMQREVEDKYASTPERLSSMVNYALLLHTQRFDTHNARKLYKDAMRVSPENPVLLRAYAIFMLLTLEAPRQVIFQKTRDMFKNAELRDPGRVRFKLAEETMFHWAVISQRDHPLALLDYALVLQTVARDFDRAERFYHRAIGALKPGDKARRNCVENFETFERERLPGGLYTSPNPSGAVLRNSRLAEEKPEWGEYARMLHTNPSKPNATYYFWLNNLTARGTWDEPDWTAVREKRVERSEFVREKQGWREYYDPRLATTFFYHPTEIKLSVLDPTLAEDISTSPTFAVAPYDDARDVRALVTTGEPR
ncbi:hypothetical protein CTAYLR_006783 [Chrysophaeum taylorii]|uniref:WW domain-containing protein n=1 Tax=Chrysophaeum taylorii TaxID=2483200 RepID=A0AAD7U7L8_9STRA|nr:hypothetical protein CTAYLR_006783 [Chrysophaeum taylorii]